jgi:RNA polymerase sigma factor (sigma-70 family)
MERMDTRHTKDVNRPESDKAAHFGRSSVASQRRGEEAPELLTGYLERIGEDDRASEVAEAAIREMENTRLQQSMVRIPARERHVLVRRYGLDDRAPATLAELSDELGITHERVRQIQRNAERRLRGRLLSERCRGDTSCGKGSATKEGARDENAIA